MHGLMTFVCCSSIRRGGGRSRSASP